MFEWFSTLRTGSRRSTPRPLGLAFQLSCESLEDRTTPTVSAIASNFNGTAIGAGDYVWFSSVAKIQGAGTSPVTVNVTNQTISFTANGTPYTLNVPDSTITLDPATKTASTSFGAGGWSIAAPTHFSGNVLLSGLSWQAVSGLPGGIKNVTWTGDFTTNTVGISVNWQWAAAVYTSFTASEASLQLKTVDDNHVDTYQNSDHAGTPENFKSFVTGGATGGGGSNWSGSLSGTASVKPSQTPPPIVETATLSGNVQFSRDFGDTIGPVIDATVTVTDSLGNVVATGPVDSSGNFSFAGIAAGTYTVTVSSPTYGSLVNSVTLTDGQTTTDNFTFIV